MTIYRYSRYLSDHFDWLTTKNGQRILRNWYSHDHNQGLITRIADFCSDYFLELKLIGIIWHATRSDFRFKIVDMTYLDIIHPILGFYCSTHIHANLPFFRINVLSCIITAPRPQGIKDIYDSRLWTFENQLLQAVTVLINYERFSKLVA